MALPRCPLCNLELLPDIAVHLANHDEVKLAVAQAEVGRLRSLLQTAPQQKESFSPANLGSKGFSFSPTKATFSFNAGPPRVNDNNNSDTSDPETDTPGAFEVARPDAARPQIRIGQGLGVPPVAGPDATGWLGQPQQQQQVFPIRTFPPPFPPTTDVATAERFFTFCDTPSSDFNDFDKFCPPGDNSIAIALWTSRVGGTFNDTPLHRAALKGHLEIVVRLVEEFGAPVNKGGNNARTPAHYAALGGHVLVLEYLASEAGADLAYTDGMGSSVLDSAKRAGDGDCISFVSSVVEGAAGRMVKSSRKR